MKKTLKRLLSLALSLALVSTSFLSIPFAASAEENLIELVKWEFDGNDSYSNAWTKGGYTTGSLTPSYTIIDGHLKVDENYTVLTSTYNRVMAQYSFGETSQFDFSKATKFTFDYYCPTGEEPSSFLLVYSGKLEGASVSTTKTDSTSFSSAAVKYDISDMTDYDKYAVSITLSSTDEFVTQREHVARLQVGEIRTNNTFSGTVYYDNITAWMINDNAPKATLNSDVAVYNKSIAAVGENMEDEVDYQWYKSSSHIDEGSAIEGATNSEYIPTMDTIGGYLYCKLTNKSSDYVSKRVKVVAGDTMMNETNIKLTNKTIAQGATTCFFVNTTATGTSSSYFDISKITPNGYFYFEYSGELTGVPQLELGTWSTAHSTTDISATETGVAENGNHYAKYSYDACVNGWGEEDFSDFKAVRAKYTGADYANLTFEKVSWFGYPASYGDLGEAVTLVSGGMLFTRHVGGDFDATRIREDSYFYIEYTGDEDGIEFVVNSHSKLVGGNNEYTPITTPSEIGKTGSGYYRIYTAAQIKEAFGSDIRYLDQIRVNTKEGKTISKKSLYFFEGTGDLIDDIGNDGYTDAIDVPWIKYADEPQDGVVVIGASITQNPLVTPAALIGAPYYKANGGWNALLDRTDCITYGIGSQTTINVKRRFKEILKYDYKQIIIQCGNNDLGAFYNNMQGAIDQEVESYKTMLNLVKEKNEELATQGKEPITVYIISLNPTNSEGIQATIVAVNNAVKELAETYDFATYIDIYNDFVNGYTGSPENPDCDENHVNMDLVMADGLHPVAAGYKIWAGYLKKAMQSKDATDTTLTTLEYRMNDTECKNVITGFETGKSNGTWNVYDMALPRTAADDATFKLYVTTSNLSAKVTSTSGDIFTDAYGDTYTEVTLANGKQTVTLTVESADGSSTEVYVINCENNGSVIGQKVSVTDETIGSWPWVEFAADNQTVYSGATVEFDVAVDNNDFTGVWLETDMNWVSFKTVTLAPEDFTNGIAHVKVTYIGETIDKLTGIEVKTGTDITDYRGDLTYFNLKFTNGTESADSDVEGLEEIILFEGEEKGTDVIKSVYTNGNFNMDNVTEDGYFYVTYTANSKDSTIRLALSDWETSRWLEIAPTASGELSEGVYFTKFSYDACVNMFDSKDFSDVDAINVKSSNIITLTKMSWFGHPIIDDGGIVLYSGSKKVSDSVQEQLTYSYTKHVGGDFDAASITYGSYFTMEYTGDEGRVIVALASVSGATEWVSVQPTSTVQLDNGRYLSTFSIEDCIAKFGANFNRLDQIQAYSYGYTSGGQINPTITLKKFKFYYGDGEIIDVDGESKWTNKATTGIGFIGDSIVQNPNVDSEHLNKIDWNGILGRTDCVNWGIGGQTTVHIERRIDDMLNNNYNKIVIHCGINDIGNGVTKDQTIANYTSMFNKIHNALPETEVYVISVLPTTTPFYATPEAQQSIRDLDKSLKQLIDNYNYVTYVNCYDSFVGEDGYCKEGLTFDGLHPNLDGYALIADILNPYLNVTDMTVYYQTRKENTEIRFIAEVSIESAQASAEAIEETLIARSDATSSFDSAYGQKTIIKAYKSLIAAGKTITAPEGKCYLISTPISGIAEGDKVKCLFTLDGKSASREVNFGFSESDDSSSVELWTGYADVGNWEEAVKLDGFKNIPTAKAGDKLIFEYTGTGDETQLAPSVQLGETWTWTQMKNAEGNTWFDTTGGKLEIILTAEQADLLVNSKQVHIGGKNAIVTRITYIPVVA